MRAAAALFDHQGRIKKKRELPGRDSNDPVLMNCKRAIDK